MNIPLGALIPALICLGFLLQILRSQHRDIGVLLQRVDVEKEKYEALYQRYNADHAAWHRAQIMGPGSFAFAPAADLGLPAPGLPSRTLGWEGGYRNASGHVQPFPPETK